MQKYHCSVCDREMHPEHRISYIDHFCDQNDHEFSIRVKDETVRILRLRLINHPERLSIKVYYDEGHSEVWTRTGSQRFIINQIVLLDFSDIEKLKNKLRFLLTFV